jgi:hypothetical protein
MRGARGRGIDQGKVTFSAFGLRPKERDLKQISVDWVECKYAPIHAQNLEGSAARMAQFVDPPYAVLQVVDVRLIQLPFHKPDACEAATKNNQCHGSITGFLDDPVQDLALQQALANVANKNPIFDPMNPNNT